MKRKAEEPPTPTLEEFLACCRAECDFLVREHGFVLLAAPQEYNQFSVCYRKGALRVEVYGENYGQNASCDLFRGKDCIHLGLLVPIEERMAVGRKGPRLDQLGQVRRIATRLRQHATDFLGGDTARFDTALAEWRRVTRRRPVSREQILDRERQTAVTEAGHAAARGEHAKVVRLLEPHIKTLSLRQRRMLETARDELKRRG